MENSAESQNPGCGSFIWKMMTTTLITLSFAAIFKRLIPESIPVDLFYAWKIQGRWSDWAWGALPILFAGLLLNVLFAAWQEFKRAAKSRVNSVRNAKTIEERIAIIATPWHLVAEPQDDTTEEDKIPHVARVDPMFLIGNGALMSVFAGFSEELLFRWIIVMDLMPVATMLNLLSCGTVRLVHEYVFGPIANFLTLGYLKPYIYFQDGWVFGFAMLWSAMRFKSGHDYQPMAGRIMSWFMGMYMFGLTMAYGLPIAMATHFCYNLLVSIFSVSQASSEHMREYAEKFAAQQRQQ